MRSNQFLDNKDKVLRNKTIPLVNVLCKNHTAKEATWEKEMRCENFILIYSGKEKFQGQHIF